MSDDKAVTLEQAWAEVDRLDKESDAACLASSAAESEYRRLRAAANKSINSWSDAYDRAAAIGPRPTKDPS